jgi:xanthine dehydrogenase molybdenum-binding subunit
MDAEEIVTGRARFIGDFNFPGMLYGKALRSSYAHARIKSVDTSRAEALPGVRAVLTHQNVPDWVSGAPPHVRVLSEKVRFVGDAVALVAGVTEEIASAALDLIEVEYEELPAVFDVEEALKPDAPQLYDQFPGNLLPVNISIFGPGTLPKLEVGDVEKGFQEADFICEGAYSYEGLPNPLPPEPPGVVVQWEGPKKLTCWSATQSASQHRYVMQPKLGFPDIRSIGLYCGGSYGSKNWYALPYFFAAALARETGRPVKVAYTKEEHLGAFVLRLGSRIKGKVGIKKDGTITAMAGEWFVDTGAFADMPQGQIAVGLGEAQLMLRCENWNIQPVLVCTNRSPSGVVRGFGGQELKSAFIPMLTMAMAKADVDPVEFFKKNFVKEGDGYFWRDGIWKTCRGVDYRAAMDKGAEVFGWKEKWKGWLKPSSVNGTKQRGVGVGVHGNADSGEDTSEAYVRLQPDGTAVIHSCTSESGTSQRNSLCKMVAEILKLPLERVNMAPPDTLVNPFEFGLAGSRGTYSVGSAVIAAAEDARQKLLETAAPKLEAEPEDLDTENGRVFVKAQPPAGLSWSKVMTVLASCTGFGKFEADYTVPNFMMTFVEVDVDVETGKVDLIRVVSATDVGQIIDPLALEGQLNGCLGAAGLDTAIFEESIWDKKTGRLLNANLIDYKWRTFSELPCLNNVILETKLPTHRYRAVGVGEISTAPAPCAVLMAVSNAIGRRMTQYPLTPDRILEALKRPEKDGAK